MTNTTVLFTTFAQKFYTNVDVLTHSMTSHTNLPLTATVIIRHNKIGKKSKSHDTRTQTLCHHTATNPLLTNTECPI